MKSKQEKKVKEEMGPFLEEGEQVRAVLIARPRGWTMSKGDDPSASARRSEGANSRGLTRPQRKRESGSLLPANAAAGAKPMGGGAGASQGRG